MGGEYMDDITSYKFYLSVLAIVKNEAPYIQEWLDYHISMGVEHFYIYDNESDDNLVDLLTPYIEKNIITYTFWPGQAQQIIAYNDALKKYKYESRWLAVIDIDEFICPTAKIKIPSLLKDYESYAGLAINWITFDSNGHICKPQGNVLENYTRINKNYQNQEINFAVKSIVNPRETLKLYIHNHEFTDKNFDVDEDFNPVGFYWNTNVPVKKIRVNHYRTKSKEEFLAKIEKGLASHVDKKRIVNKTDYNFTETAHDYTIWQHLESKKKMFYRIKHQNLQRYKIIAESNYFDAKWYIEQNTDINSEQEAVKHYCEIGWKEGKKPSMAFDGNKYLENNKDVKLADINPLLHYEMHGKKEGRNIF